MDKRRWREANPIHEISKRLVECGHEVHWFGIKWWEGESTIQQNGVYLHGVCEPKELYVDRRRSIPEEKVSSEELEEIIGIAKEIESIDKLVSILIPTKNNGYILEKSLASIQNQDYPKDRYEVIIVGGHSTDDTVEIAEKYRCKVVYKCVGAVLSLFVVQGLTGGEYFYFLVKVVKIGDDGNGKNFDRCAERPHTYTKGERKGITKGVERNNSC